MYLRFPGLADLRIDNLPLPLPSPSPPSSSLSLCSIYSNADVPSHLHYIMVELIKNSMRATVDFHGLDEMDNNPIRVVIADGEENEVNACAEGGRGGWGGGGFAVLVGVNTAT